MTMLATAYRYYDPYDQADRVVQAVQDGLYRWILCGQCTEVCDSPEIDHLTYWNDLRAAAEQRGLKMCIRDSRCCAYLRGAVALPAQR